MDIKRLSIVNHPTRGYAFILLLWFAPSLILAQEKSDSIKGKTEILSLDSALIKQLDSIYQNDQNGRRLLQKAYKNYGAKSEEVKKIWSSLHVTDSVNLIEIKDILAKKGWLGPEIVGDEGSNTLFLVIQHADLRTQEYYLPILRDAVKSGKLLPSRLALLEDRVALGRGDKQIYGSQIEIDEKTQKYFISPLLDPETVDQRRRKVGLQPLAEYVKQWNIKWDPQEYLNNQHKN